MRPLYAGFLLPVIYGCYLIQFVIFMIYLMNLKMSFDPRKPKAGTSRRYE